MSFKETLVWPTLKLYFKMSYDVDIKKKKKTENTAPESGIDENIYVHASTFDPIYLTQHEK